MSRRNLPADTDRPLDYDQLIQTLRTLVGEPIVVKATARDESAWRPGITSIVGVLGECVPSRYPDHEFSVGDPYPDRFPQHLAGGVLFLQASSFRTARLVTLDGNDHFIVSVVIRPVEIVVQDQDSGYP